MAFASLGGNTLHDLAYCIFDHRVYFLMLSELYAAVGRVLRYAMNVCRSLP